LSSMPLFRRQKVEPTVAMIFVVPASKSMDPLPSFF
jgi:hypothetical protein